MAPPAKAEENLSSLKSTVETTARLLAQLQATAPAAEPADDAKSKAVNALDLAYDATSLIKAHSTKLSLLIINKPFTATAINTVLRELVAGPLPGLASAVQICTAAKYTKAMSVELQWRAKKLFIELGTLIEVIPVNGQILNEDAKNGTGKTEGKGSLASTGVVWNACDGLMQLKTWGVAGLIIKKAESYRDLLKDALEELHEWGEESSDDDTDGDDKDEDAGSTSHISAQAAVDNMFGPQRHIPSEDTEKIRPRLESSQKRLRLVITMYTAVIKRRFKTLPLFPHPGSPQEIEENSKKGPDIVSCVDEVLDVMKQIPDVVDELASAFYDLESEEIDKRMDDCFLKGSAAVELIVRNWEGHDDEFTTWATKFQLAMKKGW